MTRSKVVDRSTVEILLDHSRAHVRRSRYSRCVSKFFSHRTHRCGDDSFGFRFRLRNPVLRKRDRCSEGPAPGAEVLRREFLPHVLVYVFVQLSSIEVEALAVGDVAKEPSAARKLQQRPDRSRELLVHDRRVHQAAGVCSIEKRNSTPAYLYVALVQGRDPERSVLLGVSLGADAEPAQVDQPDGDRTRPLRAVFLSVQVLGHRGAEIRELFGETDQLVVLRLLLPGAEGWVVKILPAPGGIHAGRLELCAGARRDPDVLPGRRDDERLDPPQLVRVRDAVASSVLVAEVPPRAHACPPTSSGHRPRVLSISAHFNPPLQSRGMDTKTIVVLEGDETGQELLEESLRVLAPDVVGLELELPRFDLSLESRRETDNAVVYEAAAAIKEHGLGLKAATITPEGAGDVGSPNRILREEIGGRVIVRTGRRIPGVVPLGGVHAPISVVRMAVGDAYGAKEWREGEGEDEIAYRTERIARRICRSVAEVAFRQAERTGAKVFGGPKYTVSPTYEGMLKEEMDAAAERHADGPHEPQLGDATVALLIASAGAPLVIPALNRDGDVLSYLVLPLFGSIAGAESLLVAFDDDYVPDAVMAEAAHGTAPALQGKNVANPMAMILAAAALLGYGGEEAQQAGRAIREACLEAVADGVRTADLAGHAATDEFTDEVIRRTKQKLDVWAAL